jgi:hypothetical protein
MPTLCIAGMPAPCLRPEMILPVQKQILNLAKQQLTKPKQIKKTNMNN